MVSICTRMNFLVVLTTFILCPFKVVSVSISVPKYPARETVKAQENILTTLSFSPLQKNSNSTYANRLAKLRRLVNAHSLTFVEQLNIIHAAKVVLQNLNPNYQLQNALFNISVSSRLDDLQTHLLHHYPMSAFEFHMRMSRIFVSLRDWHTFYLPPEPLRSAHAVLPFYVDQYWAGSKREYVVYHTRGEHASFLMHANIVAVDGVPIDAVVHRIGRRSNCRRWNDDCVRQGTSALTQEELVMHGLTKTPRRTFTMRYINDHTKTNRSASDMEDTLDFNVTTELYLEFDDDYNHYQGETEMNNILTLVGNVTDHFNFNGLHKDMISIAKETLRASFKSSRKSRIDIAPPQSRPSHSVSDQSATTSQQPWTLYRSTSEPNPHPVQHIPLNISSETSLTITAKKIKLRSGQTFGYLRIEQFQIFNASSFFPELEHILQSLPSSGLVVDIRQNPGGDAMTCINLWRSIFSGNLAAYPTVARSSMLTSDIVSPLSSYYREVMDTSLLTGAHFTGPLESWTEEETFVKARMYKGKKVIVLVDSMSISAADLFTAFVKDSLHHTDQRVLVVGTDQATNGAGATVVLFSFIVELMKKNCLFKYMKKNWFRPLPNGIDFSSAFFRFFRSGKLSGKLIEHFGVAPDHRYYETRNDIIRQGEDMLQYLGMILRHL